MDITKRSQSSQVGTWIVAILIALLAFYIGLKIGKSRLPETLPTKSEQTTQLKDSQIPQVENIEEKTKEGSTEAQKFTFQSQINPSDEIPSDEIPKAKEELFTGDLEKTPAEPEKQIPSETKETPAKVSEAPPSKISLPVSKSPDQSLENFFTIQVSSLGDRDSAALLVNKLRDKNYDAYISEAKIPGKDLVYRVRIGHFKNRDHAEAIALKLHQDEHLETWITRAGK